MEFRDLSTAQLRAIRNIIVNGVEAHAELDPWKRHDAAIKKLQRGNAALKRREHWRDIEIVREGLRERKRMKR